MIEGNTARQRASALVKATLERHGVLGQLHGSWAYNDFHLDEQSWKSESDVDLICLDLSAFQAQLLQEQLTERLATLALQVSVHRRGAIKRMNLADAQLLLIAEFLSSLAKRPKSSNYLRAKISLLAARVDVNERYRKVAFRLGSDEAKHALRVKLGKAKYFTFEQSAEMLAHSKNSTVKELINVCFSGAVDHAYLKDYLQRLNSEALTIEPWLRRYAASKLKAVLS